LHDAARRKTTTVGMFTKLFKLNSGFCSKILDGTHAREHAAELLAGAGHPDDGVGHGGDGVVALGGHHGHAGAAGMCSTRNRSTSWAVKDLITNARTL